MLLLHPDRIEYYSLEKMLGTRSHSFITTAEAAKLLGYEVQHVRYLIRAGRIKGEMFGRTWMASKSSVIEFQAARESAQKRVSTVADPQAEVLFPDYLPIPNVASVPHRSPFRYPGGKTWLVPIARAWLATLAPRRRTLIEPFAGGGGIGLLSVFERYAERAILVELDPYVASVWKAILNGNGPALAQMIRDFKLSRESAIQELAQDSSDPLQRAFQTILRNRVSRGGILAPGAGLVKVGEAGKGIASRWYPETLSERIQAIDKRRDSFAFIEGDGLEVLAKHETDQDAAFFIDPPYPKAGKRLYSCYDLDHRKLFVHMSRLKGPLLATYDDNPEIESLAREFEFETRKVPMKSTHHAKKLELLISRDFHWLPTGVSTSDLGAA